MRLEQEFSVGRPPEAVFDHLTEPANLFVAGIEALRSQTLGEFRREGPEVSTLQSPVSRFRGGIMTSGTRRAAAIGALFSAPRGLALASLEAVQEFPRGLFALACV